MDVSQVDDEDFDDILKNIDQGQSGSQLFRQWQGCNRAAKKHKEEQSVFLAQGKVDEAQGHSRTILQAEKMARAIENSAKFKEFRKKNGL
jgi:hypothetical protein